MRDIFKVTHYIIYILQEVTSENLRSGSNFSSITQWILAIKFHNNFQIVINEYSFLSSTAITASPPGTQASPHTHAVTINHPTSLDCGKVVSTPPSQYTWSTQPDLFSYYDIIKGLDGLLYFPLVTQELVDEGLVFKCQASNIELGNLVAGFINLSTENCKWVLFCKKGSSVLLETK